MNLRRKLFLCGLVVFLVGITFSLSSAQLAATPSSITPKGVAINFAQREMQASPQIRGVLQNLRQEIAARRLTFEVGYTAALDFRIEQLAGLQVPANFSQLVPAQNAAARQILQTLQAPTPVCSPTAPNFDWRKAFGVTAIRDQGACGSCWAFATVGAFEGSWRIFNGQAIESAEQDILDCNPWGYSCGGGWWAFPYLMNPGVATEASYPYTHVKGACRSVARPYHAIAWRYVGNDHNIPTVGALKQYLCAYGPLAVAVRVTPGFQAYTSGVFNEHAAGSVNHGVTLIGWDDANLEAIEAVRAGRLPAVYGQYDRDWRTFNAGLVAQHKQKALEETVALAQASQQRLLAVLSALPAEDVSRDYGVRSPRGRRVTIAMLLSAEAHDERKHAEQIREFYTPS